MSYWPNPAMAFTLIVAVGFYLQAVARLRHRRRTRPTLATDDVLDAVGRLAGDVVFVLSCFFWKAAQEEDRTNAAIDGLKRS